MRRGLKHVEHTRAGDLGAGNKGLPYEKGTETGHIGLVRVGYGSNKGLPYEKGTETNIATSPIPKIGNRNKGLPYEKGTETEC